MAGFFVITWGVLGVGAIWLPIARWLLLLEAVIYSTALFIAGLQSALQNKGLGVFIGVPISIGIMHFSWGSGFLWSAFEFMCMKLFRRRRK